MGPWAAAVDHLEGHNARDGIYINSQFVPWGRNVCLTSANKRSRIELLEDCYEEINAEGGKYILECEVEYLTITYTEMNGNVYSVPTNGSATYANVMVYDGLNIHSQVGTLVR